MSIIGDKEVCQHGYTSSLGTFTDVGNLSLEVRKRQFVLQQIYFHSIYCNLEILIYFKFRLDDRTKV